MGLQEFLEMMPLPSDDQKSKPKQPRDAHKEEMIKTLPWLAILDEKEGFEAKPTGSSSSMDTPPGGKTDSDDEDTQTVEVMKAIDLARSALSKDPQPSFDDFYCSARIASGDRDGPQGLPFACLAQTRGDLAKEFCKRRSIPYTSQFIFSVCGSPTIAYTLGRSWCHRMQHFYNLELLSPDGPGLVFTESDFTNYNEPTELTRLSGQVLPRRVVQRIRDIRGLLQ